MNSLFEMLFPKLAAEKDFVVVDGNVPRGVTLRLKYRVDHDSLYRSAYTNYAYIVCGTSLERGESLAHSIIVAGSFGLNSRSATTYLAS